MTVNLTALMVGILCGTLVTRLLIARQWIPARVLANFGTDAGPSGSRSKSGLEVLSLIVVLSQAALATFLLLHVDGAAGMIRSITAHLAPWQASAGNMEAGALPWGYLLLPLIALLAL